MYKIKLKFYNESKKHELIGSEPRPPECCPEQLCTDDPGGTSPHGSGEELYGSPEPADRLGLSPSPADVHEQNLRRRLQQVAYGHPLTEVVAVVNYSHRNHPAHALSDDSSAQELTPPEPEDPNIPELRMVNSCPTVHKQTEFMPCLKPEGEVCFACGDVISDRYLLQVSGRTWHVACLRCCVCRTSLDHQPSCFFRDDNVYCRSDYSREFGTKCSKCSRAISPTDWVRRAKEHVYHLACFACDSCQRQLSTGEEFALRDSRVLCKTHYIEVLEGGPAGDSESQQKSKTKRVRTTFTEEQLQVLQANFQLDSNPDGQDLERIAQITGLSKRVTQVWFQNSRARQKKHQQQQQKGASPAGISNNNNNNGRQHHTPSPLASVLTASPDSAWHSPVNHHGEVFVT